MKKLTCLFVLLFTMTHAHAAGNNGVGIVFGDPSGITFQHKINAQQFTDFYFAYSWDSEWILMGDYKFHLPNLFRESLPIVPYAGIGVFFKVEDKDHDDDVALGARIPLGVDWRLSDSPIVLFGELVPALRLIKSTDGDFQAGIGGRFFF